MDAKYQKFDLIKIVSDSKYLGGYKKGILYDALPKYKFLFGGTIETWKMKPVDIELQSGAKTYH